MKTLFLHYRSKGSITKFRASRYYVSSNAYPAWPMPPQRFHDTTTIQFPEQKVYIGKDSLDPLINNITSELPAAKRILIVTDPGVAKLGMVENLSAALTKKGKEVFVFDSTHPNPTTDDAVGIALSFVKNKCDIAIGFGGGGPMDAMKAGVALVANLRRNAKFDIGADGSAFLVNDLRTLCYKKMDPQYASSIPPMACIPTTAGTGSEGGKSAVITAPDGAKFLFGHPSFFSKWVALAPQFTEKLPPLLTAATGVDALFHLIEAFFVTYEAGINDGLSLAQIEQCDAFSLDGVERILSYLPTAFKDGSNLEARLQMQVAAFYAAKAFRKGDLGGVHATGHSIGALYHLHHGTAIARMSVPVLAFNEQAAKNDPSLQKKFTQLLEIYNRKNFSGKTLSEAVAKLLTKTLQLPLGLSGLNATPADLITLAKMASKDPCQTNPVKLDYQKYLSIFESANKY